MSEPVREETCGVFGEYEALLEPSCGTCSCPRELGFQKEELPPSFFFFFNTSVLTVGLGERLKEPRATDTTSTTPESKTPYLECGLLLLELGVCSFLFAVGNAASDGIK